MRDDPTTLQHGDPDARRRREQDRLVRAATEELGRAMAEAGISRADLARVLGTSRANVTAILSGERNLTLRTLADLASALGRRVEVSLEPHGPSSIAWSRLRLSAEEVAEFCRKHHIRRLALFGSVLRDDFRPDSDVDVLVEFEPGHTPGFGFIDLQDQLTGMLGRTVDLNTPQDLSPYFRDEVVRSAEVLYDEDARHAA